MLQMSYVGLRGLAGNAAIEGLQTALANYTKATGNTATDPGKVDGIVGAKTVSAVLAVLPQVTATLSGSVGAILIAGLTAASFSATAMAEAKKRIEQYAPQLTAAIQLAQVRVVGANNSNSADVTTPGLDLNPNKSVIYAFDAKVGGYRMAKPIGLQGLGAPTHIETGVSRVLPTGGVQVTLHTFQMATGTLPWYETWWGLTSIGVGVLSVGLTAVLVLRK